MSDECDELLDLILEQIAVTNKVWGLDRPADVPRWPLPEKDKDDAPRTD